MLLTPCVRHGQGAPGADAQCRAWSLEPCQCQCQCIVMGGPQPGSLELPPPSAWGLQAPAQRAPSKAQPDQMEMWALEESTTLGRSLEAGGYEPSRLIDIQRLCIQKYAADSHTGRRSLRAASSVRAAASVGHDTRHTARDSRLTAASGPYGRL